MMMMQGGGYFPMMNNNNNFNPQLNVNSQFMSFGARYGY